LIATLSEVREGAPLPLAQSERTQTPIQIRAPGEPGIVEEQTDLLGIVRSHGNSLAC
jgi:hypothetical protein